MSEYVAPDIDLPLPLWDDPNAEPPAPDDVMVYLVAEANSPPEIEAVAEAELDCEECIYRYRRQITENQQQIRKLEVLVFKEIVSELPSDQEVYAPENIPMLKYWASQSKDLMYIRALQWESLGGRAQVIQWIKELVEGVVEGN